MLFGAHAVILHAEQAHDLRIDYIVCIKRLDTSDDKREGNCNSKGWDKVIGKLRLLTQTAVLGQEQAAVIGGANCGY